MLQREYVICECIQRLELCVSILDDFGARISNALVRFEVCAGDSPNPAASSETLERVTDGNGEASLTWQCAGLDEVLQCVRISCDEPGAFVRYSRVMLIR